MFGDWHAGDEAKCLSRAIVFVHQHDQKIMNLLWHAQR
jgi:hypothetical protein